eukprot:Opistho-2@50438
MVFEFVGGVRTGVSAIFLRVMAGSSETVACVRGERKMSPSCGVSYMPNTVLNDRTAHVSGRWRDRLDKAQDGQALVDMSDHTFDGRLQERMANPKTLGTRYVWEPLNSGRPILPTDILRGKWVHSVGDSVSFSMMESFKSVLAGKHGEVRSRCVYVMDSASPVETSDNDVVLHLNKEQCTGDWPYAYVDETCAGGTDARLHIAGATTRRPNYQLFWKITSIPALGATISSQWYQASRPQQGLNLRPPFASFAPWTERYFHDMLDCWRKSSSRQSAGGSVSRERERVNVAHTGKTSATQAVGQSMPDDLRILDSASLDEIFPQNTLPDVVLVNSGLHHASELSCNSYADHVRALLTRARRDFPWNRTRLIWRSTSQTQWRMASLPREHRCRTQYRIEVLNEIARREIALFNEHESTSILPSVAVLDHFQMSLGRDDLAPDNRHYGMPLDGTVIDELLNILGGCQ